tara:strand:+ start:226 stop:504 length:279 start_codon:yes stop_codon:yes gene_type:complete
MFNLSSLLPAHFYFQRPREAVHAFIAITAIIKSVMAFLIAWRAHHRSYRSAEPNEELVRKFVESPIILFQRHCNIMPSDCILADVYEELGDV